MDNLHLLQIFPEEIWEQILGKVTCPTVLTSLNNASPFFRDRFYENRVSFLFPDVYPVLFKFIHNLHVESFKQTSLTLPMVLSRNNPNGIKRYEDKVRRHDLFNNRQSGILKLRLVSKTWCSGIDQLFTSSSYHNAVLNHPETPMSEIDVKNFSTYNLVDQMLPDHRTPEEITSNFLRHFEATHGNCDRNPFVGRAIKVFLFVGRTGFVRLAVENMEIPNLDLLKKYGHHVWFAELAVCNLAWTGDESMLLVRSLVQTLRFLPSLKTLHIDLYTGLKPVETEILNGLEDDFPQLPNLEFVSLKSRLHDTPWLLDMLARNYNHVKEFQFWGTNHDFGVTAADFQKCPMPSLNRLPVESDDDEVLDKFEEVAEVLPLDNLHLSIKKLHSVTSLFHGIEGKFANTLVDLSIEVETLDQHPERLSLPNLKRLKIAIPCLKSLDFLLSLAATLESLETGKYPGVLLKRGNATEAENDAFELCGAQAHTNIWTFFPELKTWNVGRF